MLRKFLIIFIYLFLPFGAIAQTIIQGTVLDKRTQKPVKGKVNIIFIDTLNPNLYNFITTENGTFKYLLSKKYRSLLIKIIPRHTYKSVQLFVPLTKDTFELKFFLEPLDIKHLKEVVIESHTPLREKKDTLVYLVQRFTTGNERKLKDLFNKLPGLEVDSRGRISFRGKPIKRLLLDGDDLFEDNYGVATKNINADIVKRVEIYNHYTSNPALHELAPSNDLALNVILKESATSWNTEYTIGTGITKTGSFKYEPDINLLGIKQKWKNFSFLSYNNSGIDHSSSPSYSESINYFAPSFIYSIPTQIHPLIPFPYPPDKPKGLSTTNNQWFGTFNQIIHPSKNWDITTSGSYTHDQLTFKQTSFTKLFLKDTSISYSDYYHWINTPRRGNGYLNITYHPSKNRIWTYNFKINARDIKGIQQDSTSASGFYNTHLFTADLYSQHQINYTLRKNRTTAFMYRFQFSNHIIDQKLNVKFLKADSLTKQNISLFRQTWSLAFFRFKANKQNKTSIQSGIAWSTDGSASNLHLSNISIKGDFLIRRIIPYITVNKQSQWKHWIFHGKLRWNPTLVQYDNNKSFKYVPQYFFQIKSERKITRHWNIFAGIRQNQYLPEYKRISNVPILMDQRQWYQKKYILSGITVQSFALGIKHRNSYRISFWNIKYSIDKQQGNYYERIDIHTNQIYNEILYTPLSSYSHQISTSYEKFIPSLKTDIKSVFIWKYQESFIGFKDNSIKKIYTQTKYGKFSAGTAFNGPFNLNYHLMIHHIKTQLAAHSLWELTQSAELIWRTSGPVLNLQINQIHYQGQNNPFITATFLINYESKNKNWAYEIYIKNLLNTQRYVQRYLFENGYYYEETYLQKPFIMFKCTFRP